MLSELLKDWRALTTAKRIMAKTRRRSMLLCLLVYALLAARTAHADSPGKKDYLADCARCHGADGKGDVPEMRAVPGYVAVDLTQLSKEHNGQFPREEVYQAIDGRRRLPAHFVGDMPTWGLKYQGSSVSPQAEERVRRRISALVDYIESIQAR